MDMFGMPLVKLAKTKLAPKSKQRAETVATEEDVPNAVKKNST